MNDLSYVAMLFGAMMILGTTHVKQGASDVKQGMLTMKDSSYKERKYRILQVANIIAFHFMLVSSCVFCYIVDKYFPKELSGIEIALIITACLTFNFVLAVIINSLTHYCFYALCKGS